MKDLTFPLTDFHKLKDTTNDHSIFEFVDRGVMYSQTQPSLLSKETRKIIRDFVKESTSVDITVLDKVPFGWMGVATKKDGLNYQGNFLKRLSSFLWKEHQVKLEPSLMGKLGNIIGKESSTSGKAFHFRFDPIAQYKDGEFGDAGSCFWQSRPGARSLIRNEGGSFILFFNNPTALVDDGTYTVRDGKGHTRAWILPVNQWCGTKEPLFALCNIYSDGTLNKYNVIRAISSQLNMVYKHVNINSQSDMLYVNGNCGYLMGFDTEMLDKLSKSTVIFNYGLSKYQSFGDPMLPPKPKSCRNCGNTIYPGTDDYTNYTVHHESCSVCYKKKYLACSICGTDVHRTNQIHYRGMCQGCASDKGWHRCYGCGKWHKSSIEASGHHYCKPCFDQRFYKCSRCNALMSAFNKHKNSITFCENCMTESERQTLLHCESCGQWYDRSHQAHPDFNLCNWCYYPGKKYCKCNVCGKNYHTGYDYCPHCKTRNNASSRSLIHTPVVSKPEADEIPVVTPDWELTGGFMATNAVARSYARMVGHGTAQHTGDGRVILTWGDVEQMITTRGEDEE